MRKPALAACVLILTAASQARADSTAARRVAEPRCTTDGLVHAEVSPEITRQVKSAVTLWALGTRLREPAKLVLPCGFRLDPHTGWNLVLTNGTEVRRYRENNPLGTAPPFGFGAPVAQSYSLNYRLVTEGELPRTGCGDKLKDIKDIPRICTGSGSSFFGAEREKGANLLAHYVLHEPPVRTARITHFTFDPPPWIERDFIVASINGRVESIFFLPPPDAPGGTITLIFSDREGMFRVYLDTSRG